MQPNVSSEVPAEVGPIASQAVAGLAPAPAPTEIEAVPAEAGANVIVQVRFRPDTTVWEINYLPDHLGKQEWFHLLCKRAGGKFEARAGGRGYFRLTREELEALQARNPS